jgi:WD40 repeat protein
MTPERWRRAKELYMEVLERAPAERSAFLERECAGDDALRAEVESLLAEEQVVGDLSSPATPSDDTITMVAAAGNVAGRALPAAIGRYRIIDFIGKGGMAVVYKAEQEQPRRIVALKVIKPGLAGPEYERRFEREKEALARLQHDGIARIYEAGMADSGFGPQPYFAMEYIAQGQSITAYAESKRLSSRQRLELMAQVCDAVQHAHQQSVIHRDLKPSNILVDEWGHPKVLDFGVARITDSDIGVTRQTDIGQIVGTLEYMSPEQARGDPSAVDPRSDVYALGVILYELMAGRRPHDLRNKPDFAALAVILKEDPAKLGSINREYRGDIETIAAKCLEKDKARRYSSAAELAADICRYLNNETITARPSSLGYQVRKFALRNKVAVGGAAAVFAALVAGIIATSWQARLAIQERHSAEARKLLAWANQSLNEDPERSLILGLYAWDEVRTTIGGLEQLLHDALLQSSVRLTLIGHQDAVRGISWSPDGTKLATASSDRTAKVWEVGTGRELLTLRGHRNVVNGIAWSLDGNRLATGSMDQMVGLWDLGTGGQLSTLRGLGIIYGIARSPDGSKLVTAGDDKTAKVLDLNTGLVLLTLRGHQGRVWGVAWSPDGSRLATASGDETAKVWEASTGRELLTLRGHEGPVNGIAWSLDGSKLATANADKTAEVWEASTGRELLTLRGHEGPVGGIAWSPDGTQLATASYDQTAKVWDAGTGRELLTLRGHKGTVYSVTWSPDGSQLASASMDHTAKVWDGGGRHELLTLRGHEGPLDGIAWSPDGSQLATASFDQTAKVWDADTGRELLTLRGHRARVSKIAWSPDGSKLATASRDRSAKVWEAGTGRDLLTLQGQSAFIDIAWSPDGSRLATMSDPTKSSRPAAKVWDAVTGRELLTLRVSGGFVAWSPDGRKLATQSTDGAPIVWDAATGREFLTMRDQQVNILGGAWSPDGRELATTNVDGTAKVWEASTGHELLTLRGHQGFVRGVAWSPTGRELATTSFDGTAKVWEASSGRQLFTLHGHEDIVTDVAWSPDGNRLATAGVDQKVQVYAIGRVQLLRLVRSRITRDLTPDECRLYLNTDHCPPLPSVP